MEPGKRGLVKLMCDCKLVAGWEEKNTDGSAKAGN